MYQMVYVFNGQTKFHNYDNERDLKMDFDFYSARGWNPVVYHKSSPTKPSEVPLPLESGFMRDICVGEREVMSSRIECDRFTVTFSRTATAQIDMFCDALNGWYTNWSNDVTIRLYMDGHVWTRIEPLEKADLTFERLLDKSFEEDSEKLREKYAQMSDDELINVYADWGAMGKDMDCSPKEWEIVCQEVFSRSSLQ